MDGAYENAYLSVWLIIERTHMSSAQTEEKEFSDEELEEIIDMKAPTELVKEFEAIVKESPLLVTGLVFAFGILLGVSLSSGRRRR
jgi:hypothetical protein